MASLGSTPNRRSNLLAGNEPRPWTLATLSKLKKERLGSATSYSLPRIWEVNGT